MRQLSPGERDDLRLAFEFGQMVEAGSDRATVLAALGLTDGDAGSLVERIRDPMRRARLKPGDTTQLAMILAALAPPADG